MISFDIEYLDFFVSGDINDELLNKFKKDFDISFLGRNERRRLSNCSKALFTLSKDFDLSKFCLNFSSNKGEINNCIEMLKELSATSLISPMSFSNSVLNAPLSLLGIYHKNNNELNTISSPYLKDLLISAYLRLQDNDRVAFFYYHENLHKFDFNKELFLAVFGILKKGESITLDTNYYGLDILNQLKNIINNNWDKI